MTDINENYDSAKNKIREFLKSNRLSVISTIDSELQKPEAALVAYAETELLNLIFQTFDFSRKYKNLKSNPHVAFVMGWDENSYITLQYEGIAEELERDQALVYRKIFQEKNSPCTEEFLLHPNARLFQVKPTWIGYSDYTKDSPEICELKF